MKLSDYYKVVNPTYHYYKITPLKSLRNYNTDKLLSVFAHLTENIRAKIKIEDRKLLIKRQSKFAYLIYIEKNVCEFYFIIPDYYEKLLLEKVSNCWKGVTVDKVQEIPQAEQFNYYLQYDKNYCLSLATDKRNNTLLQSIINTSELLNDNDKLCVCYNFTTCEQRYKSADHDNMVAKYVKGYGTKRTVKTVLIEIFDFIYISIFGAFGVKEDKLNHYIEPLSKDTLHKRDNVVIDTQIIVSSNNKTACVACCEAYKCISLDNELKYKKTKQNIDYSAYYMPIAKNRMSTRECQNFVSLPGREIIEEYKIKCINTLESKVPNELKTGIEYLGNTTYRGTTTPTYLNYNGNYKYQLHLITGPTRCGKSTLFENLANNYLNNDECVIAFDFCAEGRLTELFKKRFADKCFIIDCENYDKMQGLGYNEIMPSTDKFIQYENAKKQSIQLSTLINACNEEDKNLKAKMDRYLEAASLIVFIQNGSVKDVISVLQNHEKRDSFIKNVPLIQKEHLEDYIFTLRELDEKDKKTKEVIGTSYRKVEGVIDRINALKKNTYMELMLKQDCSNNINLLEEIEKNQIICIHMSEERFPTAQERDVFCVYWFTKLWLALQVRKAHIKNFKKVNLLIDEISQVEHLQALVSEKLYQMAKFGLKIILSCHYISQLTLKEGLKACNTNYTLIQGSNISNFAELKREFENLNYSDEDLMNLKQYEALHLLGTSKGYWAGITKLPKPL